jgi:hypothetical protein
VPAAKWFTPGFRNDLAATWVEAANRSIRGIMMKRILLALAGYALYRWWNKPLAEPAAVDPPIALLPPPKPTPAHRKPVQPA